MTICLRENGNGILYHCLSEFLPDHGGASRQSGGLLAQQGPAIDSSWGLQDLLKDWGTLSDDNIQVRKLVRK